ncbi:hypothetical protein HMPREF9309_01015 [Campylobacter ureolyticus ACS-301-V-Sch3b]|uniref:Galanin n=1 Tax=Campylobacter ureolyticus ACS-301-V-Sch3b TaxID=883165 RepID=S3XHH6_9BACT|nr:DUF3137 domain-containing protein [Campylobacter ureolyticus]EPH08822.1 hypothetical protein HMPREF9309_01015 [Campylobacter ureolyticus ACS-301-V-Sch3b]
MNLLELERYRKDTLKNLKNRDIKAVFHVFLILLTPFVVCALMGYGSYLEFDLSTIAIIILAFIIYYYACYYQNREIYIFEEIKKYKISFKTIYVKNFIEKQGFKYLGHKMSNKFDRILLQSSGFFNSSEVDYLDDVIEGEKFGTKFKFFEVFINSSDSNFGGVFFVADFSKEINSQTTIISKKIINFKSHNILMDNALFNDKFKVFSDNPINTMYILTPLFLEKIANLTKNFGDDIKINFKNSKIYIHIEGKYDHFEPDIYKSAITNNPAKNILDEINALLDIVEILVLNSKIYKV